MSRRKPHSRNDNWIVMVLIIIGTLFFLCGASGLYAEEFDVKYLSKLSADRFDVSALTKLNAPSKAKGDRFDASALTKLSPLDRPRPGATIYCPTDFECVHCTSMEKDVGRGDQD